MPRTVIKSVRDTIKLSEGAEKDRDAKRAGKMTRAEREEAIKKLEREMKDASKRLEFEYAAILRDRIIELRGEK